MVSEAVASIREVCPDELNNYQDTITGLFGDAAIAQITASIEAEETTLEATPEAPSPEDEQTIDVVAEAQPEENTAAIVEQINQMVAELPWNQYRKFVNGQAIPGGIARKSKDQIQASFEQFLASRNNEELRGMIASLRNV
ncbi:MAG TPA: hypothetical protein VE956_07175 [Nodularia sp. (in: cyanobacteria)]|nr:hypothetical protein [Nodularia sp. (in: cyanobacteria)]